MGLPLHCMQASTLFVASMSSYVHESALPWDRVQTWYRKHMAKYGKIQHSVRISGCAMATTQVNHQQFSRSYALALDRHNVDRHLVFIVPTML